MIRDYFLVALVLDKWCGCVELALSYIVLIVRLYPAPASSNGIIQCTLGEIYIQRERDRACSHLLYRESVYKEALFIFLWISAYSRWILVCWWRYRTGLCHYNSTLCLPPSHFWCCPLKYTYFFISFWWNRRNCCYLYSFENVEENFLCIALYKELKDAIESYLWIPCKYIMSSFWGS